MRAKDEIWKALDAFSRLMWCKSDGGDEEKREDGIGEGIGDSSGSSKSRGKRGPLRGTLVSHFDQL